MVDRLYDFSLDSDPKWKRNHHLDDFGSGSVRVNFICRSAGMATQVQSDHEGSTFTNFTCFVPSFSATLKFTTSPGARLLWTMV